MYTNLQELVHNCGKILKSYACYYSYNVQQRLQIYRNELQQTNKKAYQVSLPYDLINRKQRLMESGTSTWVLLLVVLQILRLVV